MRIPKWRLLTALLAASLAAAPLVRPAPAAQAAVLAGPNLAAGKAASASSSTQNYAASNVTDSNQSSYWESANNAFPQWVQVDLGTSVATNQVVLKLPTANWGARDETLAIQGSTDGQNFTDLSASAARTFSPPNNTVTVDYGTATTRYVRIRITANTGWPAGQLSELEVYGLATGDTQAPTAPGNLAFTEPGAGQIKLTWSASTDNVGVTGYDVYANGQLRTSVAGNVLTYTDNQPVNVSIAYTVRGKDAAGNQSANSNTVTRNSSGGPGSNLALHKPISASGSTFTYVPANANDDDVTTYWEGNANPATLTTELGANADLSSIVVRLSLDPAWGPRTQTFSILGREQSSSNFTTIVASAGYDFNPASGNSVTIPVSARVADVRLNFTGNTGAPAGQVAELQVLGVPAPNPDLTPSNVSWTPTSPVETDAITVRATVNNGGTAGSAATDVNFYLGTTKVGTAAVGALAAGASTTVSASIGTRDAGSYALSAKVDEGGSVIEQNDGNNTAAAAGPLVVTPVASSDLVAAAVNWTPGNPSAGNAVAFSVSLKNQGSVASASGAHGITLTVLNGSSVVTTLTGSYNGAIAAGATTPTVALGNWTATNGRYTVRVVLADDANELPVKRSNNTSERPFFVGRGANMPYDHLEAEDAAVGGGASVIGPNRTIGDLAGEASGRRAVTLGSNGAYVEFTTRASTNTLVTRFSMPDSSGGGGQTSSISVYVNGSFAKTLPLTSKHAWLYGAEASPNNSPGSGPARHIYDEANLMLGQTYPAGTKIRLQKDPANSLTYTIDFLDTEAATPVPNPGAGFVTPAGFTHHDVQNALDQVRQDSNLQGVYLPAGDYDTSSKFQVYGKAVKIVGAGPWFTRFHAPTTQDNTDVGFRSEASANGSTFSGFAYLGNYTSRIDGPGKVFDFSGTANMTIDNIWVEHMVCMYWGSNTDTSTIKNSRIRDTFADGINMTNGSAGNTVSNNDARSTGDDSFALFNATDNGGGEVRDNVFENLSATLTWRAAGFAVYGGTNNVFRNLYAADMLTYPGITISSLDFGIPMNGFGATPPTQFQNVSVVRSGGHFWGNQAFPAVWIFSASKIFQGIRVNDLDIVDPTYSGIMFQTNYVGGQPQFPVADTVFTNTTISGARKSGDAFDAKSGFGIWANELPEPGQGPALGAVTFNNLTLTNNAKDIQNTTTTFTLNRN
ncbi:parallel beta helix pectate lyase-like protein [Kribbella sp. VKM Ac-2569]|uniref:discoidin domain-containing protein n=1 Tax=Kribbella sp. VKM Ac-2569 TaxID=2512220 RepID=UPI00102C3BEF|nr:discoidin domain-containing protein [Kribbella sp. VKM Ac-2569]RZT15315.1 parallel beta helix pectate lyase-like protein [Kribbella sp. VKM Ac-2569]